MGDFWVSGFESILFTAILYLTGCLIALGFGWQGLRTFMSQKPSRWAWVFLLAGLLFRLGWIVFTQPDPISDYEGYWAIAGQIAAGDFTFNNIDKHPGIILLLAACRALFGFAYWPVWGMNLALSGLVMLFIYLLAERLFNRSVALLALALAAFQPQLITYSALFASELPTLFLYLLLIWMTLESRQPVMPEKNHWGRMGMVLYISVLTRSTALLFGPLAALVVVFFRRDRWLAGLKGLAIFAASAGILLSTWLYHQYLLTGQAKLFWGGEIWLVSTTHYETESRLVHPRSIPGLRERIAKAIEGKTGPQARLAELAEDKAWAVAIIRQDPMRYLQGGPTRLRHILWTTSETGIRDTQWGSARLQSLPGKTMTRMAETSKHLWRVTLIAGLLGLLFALMGWKRRSLSAKEGLVVIVGFLTVWLTFHFLMAVASDRWAVQIIPFILIFAAEGVMTILNGIMGFLKTAKR